MFGNGKDVNIQWKWIWTAVTVVWMAVIFSFSAQPAEQSGRVSHSVGETVARVVVPDFQELSEGERTAYVEKIDHPIRKMGHAGEYTVLGFLLLMAVSAHGGRGKQALLSAWGMGILYAAGDEFHQLFVPGRSCQVTDVMIDSGGVLVGILLAELVLRGTTLAAKRPHGTEESDGKETRTDQDEDAAAYGGAAGESGI